MAGWTGGKGLGAAEGAVKVGRRLCKYFGGGSGGVCAFWVGGFGWQASVTGSPRQKPPARCFMGAAAATLECAVLCSQRSQGRRRRQRAAQMDGWMVEGWRARGAGWARARGDAHMAAWPWAVGRVREDCTQGVGAWVGG